MTINEDGSVAWQQFHPGNPNVMEMATVDMNGNVFIPDWLGVEGTDERAERVAIRIHDARSATTRSTS